MDLTRGDPQAGPRHPEAPPPLLPTFPWRSCSLRCSRGEERGVETLCTVVGAEPH